jgi:peptidoglycan hydrolase-like protein with peptidoglycan-binding domain
LLPPLPRPPTPICDPQSPTTLQLGSTGAKVAELQRVLTQVGYGSLLLGQGGGSSGGGAIGGKFTTSTQNAVKKFQQDNRLPVDGKVGPITWGILCGIIPNSFIVQLKSAAGSNPLSPLSSRPPTPSSVMEIIGSLTPQIAAAGGRIVAVYDQFGMFNMVFEGPQAKREQFINSLRANPAVQGVFNDHIVSATQLPPQPQPPQQQTIPTGVNRVDADLSAAKSGDGVGPEVDADIAILDTGVNRHPDLNLFQCVSFLYLVSIPFPLCNDRSDHGTLVAGVAAAKDNNIGVVGTAPGARIWALKVLGDNGNGDESDAIEGLNYVAAHAKEIEVANLSFEQAGFSFPFFVATSILVLRGVVVVAAAGNSNIDANSVAPANIPWVITVSAITDSDGKCGGAGLAIPAQKNIGFNLTVYVILMTSLDHLPTMAQQ